MNEQITCEAKIAGYQRLEEILGDSANRWERIFGYFAMSGVAAGQGLLFGYARGAAPEYPWMISTPHLLAVTLPAYAALSAAVVGRKTARDEMRRQEVADAIEALRNGSEAPEDKGEPSLVDIARNPLARGYLIRCAGTPPALFAAAFMASYALGSWCRQLSGQ